MKKVFFVLNSLSLYNFQHHIDKYLGNYKVAIGEVVPDNPEEYMLVILWNYQKIIKLNNEYKNFIVFHGSDLPKGKGWAPIYYALVENQEYYTISGIFADEKVDSGDIIVKARFKIRDNYTAESIRIWDEEIMIMLTQRILQKCDDKDILGLQQQGCETYNVRRKPLDSEVNINCKIVDMIPHLRACEKRTPAFFFYNSIRYNIFIEPVEKPQFPNDLEIKFAGENWKKMIDE